MYNEILRRQLETHFGGPDAIPANCLDLLILVSDTYDKFETAHQLTERAIDIKSKELVSGNESLRTENQELHKAHLELKTLFDDISEVLYSIDMVDHKVNQVSEVCEKIYGYTSAEFRADAGFWRKVAHPADRHIYDSQVQNLRAGQQVLNQYRIMHKDGSIRWIENRIMPTISANGQLTQIDGVTSDITKRKMSIQRLTDSERKYRTLFEQNLAGVYRTTHQGHLVTCNKAFATMLGYDTPSELLGVNAASFYFNEQDRNFFINSLKLNGKLHNYELVLKRRDGKPVYVIENVTFHSDPITEEEFFDGVMIDVTERKRAEHVLELSNKRLEEAEELGNSGYWHCDLVKNVVTWSAGNCRIYGIKPEEFGGTYEDYISRIHPDDEDRIRKPVAGSSSSSQYESFEFRIIRPDGTIRRLIETGKSNHDASGRVTSLFGTSLDITEISRAEETIRKSEALLELKNSELQLKNNELEQFAYIASHDLQEPLRTITSFLELLRKLFDANMDQKAVEYFGFIFKSTDRMKALIKDLLDFSTIETKKEVAVVDCNTLLEEVLSDLDIALKEAGAVVIASQMPVIKGHYTGIKQLFQNLISNGIKFRKKNTSPVIKIQSELTSKGWKFSFADNGIGIEPNNQHKIFVIFQRLHSRQDYEGTGIGLAHCKKIVESHKGEIWVESLPGEGSTFHFTIQKDLS